jgi:hypothetical protein
MTPKHATAIPGRPVYRAQTSDNIQDDLINPLLPCPSNSTRTLNCHFQSHVLRIHVVVPHHCSQEQVIRTTSSSEQSTLRMLFGLRLCHSTAWTRPTWFIQRDG